MGISALNRHWGDICGKWRRKERGSRVHRPPSRWNNETFVGEVHYSMHFTLGHQIPIVTAVIIKFDPWQQLLFFLEYKRYHLYLEGAQNREFTIFIVKIWDVFI